MLMFACLGNFVVIVSRLYPSGFYLDFILTEDLSTTLGKNSRMNSFILNGLQQIILNDDSFAYLEHYVKCERGFLKSKCFKHEVFSIITDNDWYSCFKYISSQEQYLYRSC